MREANLIWAWLSNNEICNGIKRNLCFINDWALSDLLWNMPFPCVERRGWLMEEAGDLEVPSNCRGSFSVIQSSGEWPGLSLLPSLEAWRCGEMQRSWSLPVVCCFRGDEKLKWWWPDYVVIEGEKLILMEMQPTMIWPWKEVKAFF